MYSHLHETSIFVAVTTVSPVMLGRVHWVIRIVGYMVAVVRISRSSAVIVAVSIVIHLSRLVVIHVAVAFVERNFRIISVIVITEWIASLF